MSPTSSSTSDFRAAERTFQLLTQVAGRAGRGDQPGEVIMQSYDPDHPALRAASAQDFGAFYAREARDRRELSYPPFGHLVEIEITGKGEERVYKGLPGEEGAGEGGGRRFEILAPRPRRSLASRERRVASGRALPSRPASGLLSEAFRASRPQAAGVRLGIDVDPHHCFNGWRKRVTVPQSPPRAWNWA